jgi:hypothetical protein
MKVRPEISSFSKLLAIFFLHGITSGHLWAANATMPLPDLAKAAAAGNQDAVRTLLAGGKAVDEKDASEWTALHHAAAGGFTAVASLLLDHGADPNARDAFGMTPLHWAATLGRAEVAGLLARRGARTDGRSDYGMTPMHLAADDKVVKMLCNAGADVNALDDRGRTPLHTARHGVVGKELIECKADLRIRTPQGRTAMELANVDSTEKAGFSVQGPMLARLRGLISQASLTVMNISTRPIDDFKLSGRSQKCCSVDVTPPGLPSLQPGQVQEFTLTFVRKTGADEGEFPIWLKASAGSTPLVDFDLRINTQMNEIPEDTGVIRLAKGSLRPAPSRLHYLAYLAAPLFVFVAWYVVKRRRKMSQR